MQNINPTNNRNRRSRFYLWILGIPVLIGSLTACASVVLLSMFPLLGNATTLGMACLMILAILGLIGGGISTYRGLTLEHDNKIAYEVGEYLKYFLTPEYTFVRNVSRRNLGYIDAVLLGPPGALVFRVVDYGGTWRNELAEWKIRDAQGRVRTAPTNPSRECARDVYALRTYFGKRSLQDIPVYGMVVFHNPTMELQGDGSVVPISKTELLQDILPLEYLEQEQRIPPDLVQRAVLAITEG
jgi:hypothetical protein